MRLFVAVRLDPGFVRTLTGIQEKMKAAGVRGNYSKPENLHITLAFIGEYDDPKKALDAVKSVKITPFEIALSGIGSFGSLWWVGLSGSAPLYECAKNVRAALDAAGIPFDRKKFSPHITLIRQPDKATYPKITVPDTKMTVGRISLMRSDRGPNGMIYTEIV